MNKAVRHSPFLLFSVVLPHIWLGKLIYLYPSAQYNITPMIFSPCSYCDNLLFSLKEDGFLSNTILFAS